MQTLQGHPSVLIGEIFGFGILGLPCQMGGGQSEDGAEYKIARQGNPQKTKRHGQFVNSLNLTREEIRTLASSEPTPYSRCSLADAFQWTDRQYGESGEGRCWRNGASMNWTSSEVLGTAAPLSSARLRARALSPQSSGDRVFEGSW